MWGTNWSNCIYCGVFMRRYGYREHGLKKLGKHQVPAVMTKEHLYPLKMGGWLVVPACTVCNSHRGSLSLYAFWKMPYLAKRRAWARGTPGWKPWAPAKELVRLYERARPKGLVRRSGMCKVAPPLPRLARWPRVDMRQALAADIAASTPPVPSDEAAAAP